MKNYVSQTENRVKARKACLVKSKSTIKPSWTDGSETNEYMIETWVFFRVFLER
jgi:hypothetical protein